MLIRLQNPNKWNLTLYLLSDDGIKTISYFPNRVLVVGGMVYLASIVLGIVTTYLYLLIAVGTAVLAAYVTSYTSGRREAILALSDEQLETRSKVIVRWDDMTDFDITEGRIRIKSGRRVIRLKTDASSMKAVEALARLRLKDRIFVLHV